MKRYIIAVVGNDFSGRLFSTAADAMNHVGISTFPASVSVDSNFTDEGLVFLEITSTPNGETRQSLCYLRGFPSLENVIETLQQVMQGIACTGVTNSGGGPEDGGGILANGEGTENGTGLGLFDNGLPPIVSGLLLLYSGSKYLETKNKAWLAAAGYAGINFINKK